MNNTTFKFKCTECRAEQANSTRTTIRKVSFPGNAGICTGLKDKNGKDIYENDVVTGDGLKYPHIVKFLPKGFGMTRYEGWANHCGFYIVEMTPGTKTPGRNVEKTHDMAYAIPLTSFLARDIKIRK